MRGFGVVFTASVSARTGEVVISPYEGVPATGFRANTLEASTQDALLATGALKFDVIGGASPVHEELLSSLFSDHITNPRVIEHAWMKPPRRRGDGDPCVTRRSDSRPRCDPPDPDFCLHHLPMFLFDAATRGFLYIKQMHDKLRHAVEANDGYATSAPPVSGHALTCVRALDDVIDLFVALFERADFNPRLGACFGTPLGDVLRSHVLGALEMRKALAPDLEEMRWQLAANSRFGEGRYGQYRWQLDLTWKIALKAGWALHYLARIGKAVDWHLTTKARAAAFLRENATELDTGPLENWNMLLKTSLFTERYYLDKGLVRFLLADVLRRGETVCDFGAFAGHYSRWFNDTGLVTAFAFDSLPGVEKLTNGNVRHASLETRGLDVGPCDIAFCLEVLEHISAESEEVVVRNLGRHARRALILSWAPPNVPGIGHINTKSEEEQEVVIERLAGLRRDAALTTEARARAEIPWIAESVAVYFRPGVA